LAAKEGKSQDWVSLRLRFGRLEGPLARADLAGRLDRPRRLHRRARADRVDLLGR
jgi:hypothetical protein